MSFDDFVGVLSNTDIEFEHLKVPQLAQAILESGRGKSALFQEFNNPFGMKFRSEMKEFAKPAEYTDHAGETDDYCHFATYKDAVRGYWRFIARDVYSGWRRAVETPRQYIDFIAYAGYVGGPHYAVPAQDRAKDRRLKDAYVDKVVSLFGEAEDRLGQVIVDMQPRGEAVKYRGKGVYLDVGHGAKPAGYDPGAVNKPGGFTEHQLNVIAADACAQKLREHGIACKVDDSRVTNEQAGRAATNYDVFVSVHHNSDEQDVQGALGLYYSKNIRKNDRKLSDAVGAEMAKELGIPQHGSRAANFAVLRGALKAKVRAATLAEVYFMHHQTNPNPDPRDFPDWSKRGGEALARGIMAWLKDNP